MTSYSRGHLTQSEDTLAFPVVCVRGSSNDILSKDQGDYESSTTPTGAQLAHTDYSGSAGACMVGWHKTPKWTVNISEAKADSAKRAELT